MLLLKQIHMVCRYFNVLLFFRRRWARAQRQAAKEDVEHAAVVQQQSVDAVEGTEHMEADDQGEAFCLTITVTSEFADALAYAMATGVEQSTSERRAAAMQLGGVVEADPRATRTIKRRTRRRRLEKMHSKMRRGKFWEIREIQKENQLA
jgi:hypothetical protein